MAMQKDYFPYIDGAKKPALRSNTPYSLTDLSDILDIPTLGKMLAYHEKGEFFVIDEDRTQNGLERLSITEKSDFVAGEFTLSLSYIQDQRLVQDARLTFKRSPETKLWECNIYGFTLNKTRGWLPDSNKTAFKEIGRFILHRQNKTRTKIKHPIKRKIT